MRYLMLICTDERPSPPRARRAAALSPNTACSWRRWASGACCRAASACTPPPTPRPSASATARPSTSDGPFAETKEQIGGYFVVDCKDLDEAIEIAAKIPGRPIGYDRSEADLGDVTPDADARLDGRGLP